jgi:hypothetical protein
VICTSERQAGQVIAPGANAALGKIGEIQLGIY